MQAQPAVIADAATAGSAEKIYSFYLITPSINLQTSGNQLQRVYLNVDLLVGQLNTGKYKIILSSSPTANTPFVTDDAVYISGQRLACGTVSDPSIAWAHLGENPAVWYQTAPAVDVTGCLRRDGHMLVQCLDLGGGVFGCSALYLRVVPK